MKTVKTISLQGKDYAPVKERLKAFKEDFPKSKIETSYVFKEWHVIFEAVIYPKFDEEHTIWNWHSFWKLDKAKSFEKLETIAIGRALWIAWYWADWDIASFDEMSEYLDTNEITELEVFRKKEFKEIAEELNNWWKDFANGWIEDNKEIYFIGDSIKKKIKELYKIFTEFSKVTDDDINHIWSNAERAAEEAKGIK